AQLFTAGSGESSTELRRRISEASAWLGIELDEKANAGKGPRISKPQSKVSVWVIPTNEELMIARHTSALLGLQSAGNPPTHREEAHHAGDRRTQNGLPLGWFQARSLAKRDQRPRFYPAKLRTV